MDNNSRAILSVATIVIVALTGMYVAREPIKHAAFSYLSRSKPTTADVLVIEGWLTDRMLKEAAAEYLRGNYRYCLLSGRSYLSRSPEELLIRSGIDSTSVKFTDAETRKGHNTYHIALAARQWLQTHDPNVMSINIFTAGPHGPKSWIIFKRVFGKNYRVGVLTSSIERSDTDLWWESKQGTRNLIKYVIGYFYGMLWPFKE